MSELIDREAVEQATALFDSERPGDAAYGDTTDVTVTLSKGTAYLIRGWLRRSAQEFLSNIDMADMFGYEPTEAQAEDTNSALRQIVALDAVLAEVAPVSDYPVEDDEPEVAEAV